MSHRTDNACSFASSVQEQLKSDKFIQQLTTTTMFRNMRPASMPLAMLEDICNRTDTTILGKNERLDLVNEGDYLFEILSGYVKICDPPRPHENVAAHENEPALLAWRIPGELL